MGVLQTDPNPYTHVSKTNKKKKNPRKYTTDSKKESELCSNPTFPVYKL